MKHIFSTLSVLFLCLTAFAGIDPPAYMKWTGTDLDQNNVLSIQDNKYDIMTTSNTWGFTNGSVKNEIVFKVDPLQINYEMDFTASIEADIDLYDETGNLVPGSPFKRTFSIDFDSRAGTDYTEKSYVSFDQGYKMDIEIRNVNFNYNSNAVGFTGLPSFLQLEARI